ncbi:ferritin-like domain-containing protein [Fulvivirga maritima]|uniref:ferritin-like domain-containing protein n=1 Tax=Fulvivirga maritima TaxID=2904247 RepID=UPI001F41663A|nr:ferritin-like domain-containing protein [Fulvivirga maritima]UII28534.1 ferritin-like domain-containing protein [Fulvivirga maritima]
MKKIDVYPKYNRDRRSFLKAGGAGLAAAGLLLTGCSDDDDGGNNPDPDVFDLGSGDLAVLNYAYALEQLEADFYAKVFSSFYAGITTEEQTILTDIYYHEVIHRNFFKAAISGVASESQILPELEFDYGDLDFNDRSAVLATAKALEDTGVGAYNGAGNLLETPEYLLIAGKIVSVEARHASAIRSLINPDSKDFAGDDIVDASGLDTAKLPSEIIPVAAGFITTPFTANNLP